MKIVFENVTKKYKKKIAVNNLDLQLEEGIYGLLGPNGAGKSTLMKMLVGNVRQTDGVISCNGTQISHMGNEYRQKIGYMPQQQEVYSYFTGRRFLLYMCALKGIKKKNINSYVEEIAQKVNLLEALDKRIGGYSGGMRQRILIAQALLGEPELLVFDEPTAGLDPKERIRVRNLISENSEGKIVLIATHVVQDIEYIANEIILIKDGNIVGINEPDKLVQEIEGKVWELEIPVEDVESISRDTQISNMSRHGENAKLKIISDKQPHLMAKLAVPDIEDYYLYTFSN